MSRNKTNNYDATTEKKRCASDLSTKVNKTVFVCTYFLVIIDYSFRRIFAAPLRILICRGVICFNLLHKLDSTVDATRCLLVNPFGNAIALVLIRTLKAAVFCYKICDVPALQR